jgi:hypothetical protein
MAAPFIFNKHSKSTFRIKIGLEMRVIQRVDRHINKVQKITTSKHFSHINSSNFD